MSNIKTNKQKNTSRLKGSKPPHTAEAPLIKKAVARAVREYGETLKKLARDD